MPKTHIEKMTSIQLYKQDTALVGIPSKDKEIAFALTSPIFSSLSPENAYDVMKQSITRAYLLAKYECPVGVELQIIVDETMKIFQIRFGSIRKNEIDICFARGIMGDYGEFKGLALPAFSSFATGYLKEQSRIKLTTPTELEKMQPTELEIFEISKSNALKAFSELQRNGTVGSFGGVVYDFLNKIKLIELEQQEKNEYWKQAKEEYLNFLTVSMANPLDMPERNRLKKDLELFQNGEKKDRIIAISKRLIVDDYYRSLIIEEINLEQELEAIKKEFKND